ncbi:SDR family oxidoreductase [soil metagenome]
MNESTSVKRLIGKRVIITGAGQGLGEATAHYLAEQGVRVVVADIQDDKARTVAADIVAKGGEAVATRVDVTSWDSVTALVDTAVTEFGGLDGLVNNAGIVHLGLPADDTEALGGRRVFEVNVLGTYQMGIAAVQYFSEHGGGTIVNVTSGVHAGLGSAASYSASKGAVASLTYSWAIDLAASNIKVNAISPVATTEMTLNSEARMRESGELTGETPIVPPRRNCAAIAYLLSDASDGLAGQILRVHDRTLQLIAHPVVMDEVVCDGEEWTIDGVEETVEKRFKDNLPPLGLAAADVTYRDMSIVNIVIGIDPKTGLPAKK